MHNITTYRQDALIMRWALFSLAGIAFTVLLRTVGITRGLSDQIRELLALSPDCFMVPPVVMYLLFILLTLFFTLNFLLIKGIKRKIIILTAFPAILLIAAPLLAMWGMFFNPLPTIQSVVLSGLLAILFPLPEIPGKQESPHFDHE